MVVDHIDRNIKNNCRSNLRVVSHSVNSQNKTRNPKHTNKYVGVTKHKGTGKWLVKVANVSYGEYTDEDHAARVYNHFAKLEYGDDAALNSVTNDLSFTPPVIQRRTQRNDGCVSFLKRTGRWGCRLVIEGKRTSLGNYATQEEAFIVLQKKRDPIRKAEEERHNSLPIRRNADGVAVVEVKAGVETVFAKVSDT